ncbi:unnamed protein product [Lactuca saligna]|uniref:Uncharacterized protein n=1 Tax=Lactuca saligna TaxID=75948 RepID=A0AA36E9Y2_LACSI|nr:unnamed protein product [Lactuca saligna]
MIDPPRLLRFIPSSLISIKFLSFQINCRPELEMPYPSLQLTNLFNCSLRPLLDCCQEATPEMEQHPAKSRGYQTLSPKTLFPSASSFFFISNRHEEGCPQKAILEPSIPFCCDWQQNVKKNGGLRSSVDPRRIISEGTASGEGGVGGGDGRPLARRWSWCPISLLHYLRKVSIEQHSLFLYHPANINSFRPCLPPPNPKTPSLTFPKHYKDMLWNMKLRIDDLLVRNGQVVELEKKVEKHNLLRKARKELAEARI